MALFRPCRPGRAECHESAARGLASRDLVLRRGCARYRGLRRALCAASNGIFAKGLYLFLAIVLLHDIFAPHPFGPPVVLFDGNLSVLTLDGCHQSAVGFFEDDENHSVPNRRGTLLPALSVNFNSALHLFFHPLLLIATDERPPKA